MKPTPKRPQKPLRIGLTGGIASGKTLVSNHLAARGFGVIDTDVLARELLERDRATRAEIRRTLGTTDRRQLRELVFSDPRKRRALEKILHPRIWKNVEASIQELSRSKKPPPLIFIVVPLLFETKSERRYDRILCIRSSRTSQMKRLLERPGITPRIARAILAAQASPQEVARKADHVIWNRTTPQFLRWRVDEWVKKILRE